MDLGALYRMATPPAPEPARLRRFRLLVSGLLLTLAALLVFQQLIVGLWRPLIILYPLLTLAALIAAVAFFRMKARWNETWWTEERRAEHYAKVAAGRAPPDRSRPPVPSNRWRRPF